MKQRKVKTAREYFRDAYRMAREPDRYLADDMMSLNFPVRYLFLAVFCLDQRIENHE